MARQNTEEKTPKEMLLTLPTISQSNWTWPRAQPSSYRHTLITLTIPESSMPRTSNCIFPHFAMGKRHRLASGRRGALLLVCLKHRSASPFPKESALPKAIGCHNRSALRPWVNICARCLFELLQPRYLPRTPPGLIRELMAPHQEITLCEGSREREGGKEL